MTISTARPIKVFIAEDQQLFSDLFKKALNTESDLKFVGRASDGEELLERLKNVEPDVILMDIRMPKMDGITASNKLKALYPFVKVLMVSQFNSRDYIKASTMNGADGYISKAQSSKVLFEGIRRVHKGEFFVAVEPDNNKKKSNYLRIRSLTKREKEVLCLFVKGFRGPEVAEKLEIKKYTVEEHSKNIKLKLGAKSLVEMVTIALECGICKDL